jgi:hypothetical protein
MTRIIIESENQNDIELIRKLALRLKARIRYENDSDSISVAGEEEPTKQGFLKALENAVKDGGIKSIDNPAEWQKKIRKNRKIN